MTAAKTATVGAAMFLIGLAGGQSTAHATTAPKTLTVTWSTTADPAKPLPTDASNVPWPQHLLSPVPSCLPKATVVQVDVYEYVAHKAAVDALIAHGVLNAPGSKTFDDSAFVQSWSFRVIPACATASPTPTVSTSTPNPSPSTSSTTSTPAPSTTAPAPTSSAPSTSPVPVSTTPGATTSTRKAAPAVPASTPAAPGSPSTPAVVVSPPLANTGAPTGRLTLVGLVLLAAGAGLAFINRMGKRA